MAGLFDTLFAGIADAIGDIRQRAVEEGWFGRIVTGDPVEMTGGHPTYREIEPEPRSFEEMWAADPAPAREPGGPEHEAPGIDR